MKFLLGFYLCIKGRLLMSNAIGVLMFEILVLKKCSDLVKNLLEVLCTILIKYFHIHLCITIDALLQCHVCNITST